VAGPFQFDGSMFASSGSPSPSSFRSPGGVRGQRPAWL